MSHASVLIEKDILAYLDQHENKDLLRFLTCGSVDDGKSTLIGRLLFDSKLIFEDHLAALHKDNERQGNAGAWFLSIPFSWLRIRLYIISRFSGQPIQRPANRMAPYSDPLRSFSARYSTTFRVFS